MNTVNHARRWNDALGHLQQYGVCLDPNAVDALESLARIFDDLAHGREPSGMRQDVDHAHAALDRILPRVSAVDKALEADHTWTEPEVIAALVAEVRRLSAQAKPAPARPATRRTILGDLPVDETGLDRLDHALVSTRDAFAVERRSYEQRLETLSERLADAQDRLVESGKAQRLRNRRHNFAERVALELVRGGYAANGTDSIVAKAREIADKMYPGASS